MKKCNKCKKNKYLKDFHKNKTTKDGINTHCKECMKNHSLNYRQKNKKNNFINVEKQCYCCKKTKIASQFHRKIDSKDGLYSHCKMCRSINRKKYYKNNVNKIIQYNNKYTKLRKKQDVLFRLTVNLRSRLNMAINKNYKSGSAIKDLGCSVEYLKQYLESKFTENMSWNNYGDWHIDHIRPLSSFDLTNKNQLMEACHYNNLQPLWAIDNLKKGSFN